MKNKKRWIKWIALVALAVLFVAAAVYGIVCIVRYNALEDTGLPVLEIMTEGEADIVSKTDYIGCKVTLRETDAEYYFTDLAAEVRGRGNDTWKYYPKKPYRIKFTEKTSMFGEPANKSWVLLAMYNDFTLTKDRLAFGLADSIGGDAFVPSYHYVDLYLNGSYMGLYLLTDQVDENKGRINVKEKFDETDTEVPFFVELDARAPEEGEEGVDWFEVGGRPYAIKYPEADERYNDAQFAYIENYIETVHALCHKENVTLAELSEYIDVQSFMDFYLVQELMGQQEINWKSVYMSKTTDGVLKMGPVWDFDWGAMGPSLGENSYNYRDTYDGFRSVDNWFASLYKGSPEFCAALSERWFALRGGFEGAIAQVETEKNIIARAAERDRLRWHWYRFGGDYEESFDELIEWCRHRITWMDAEMSKYDAGRGVMTR